MNPIEALGAMQREGWSQVPLWAIARRVSERDFPDMPLLSVYREFGVVLREGRDDNHNRASDDLASYQRVLPGDLVLNKMKMWQGSLGVSAHAGIVSPAYFVCRTDENRVDGRFLHHLLRSRPYVACYAALSKGIRPGQWDLPWEQFRMLPVLVPPMDEQRRIAAFLDAQVDLLDKAIALRQQETLLLDERFGSLLERTLWGSSPSDTTMRLGFAVERVTSGPRGWGDFVSPEGRPFFRSANLRRESLEPRLDNLVRVAPPSAAQSEAGRAAVEPGDVLVGITGANAGWVTVVRGADLDGAVVSQHVALVRPARTQLSPEWLGHLLRSQGCAVQLAAMQYGGTKTQLSLPNLRDLRIPSRPLALQVAEAQALNEQAEVLESYRAAAQNHVSFLQERKQALVAATVTGVLDVSTARSAA